MASILFRPQCVNINRATLRLDEILGYDIRPLQWIMVTTLRTSSFVEPGTPDISINYLPILAASQQTHYEITTSKRRHFDVITSKWRFDLITTLLLRYVFSWIYASWNLAIVLARSAPSLHLNQCWLLMKHIPRNRLQWKNIESNRFPFTKFHLKLSFVISPSFILSGGGGVRDIPCTSHVRLCNDVSGELQICDHLWEISINATSTFLLIESIGRVYPRDLAHHSLLGFDCGSLLVTFYPYPSRLLYWHTFKQKGRQMTALVAGHWRRWRQLQHPQWRPEQSSWRPFRFF